MLSLKLELQVIRRKIHISLAMVELDIMFLERYKKENWAKLGFENLFFVNSSTPVTRVVFLAVAVVKDLLSTSHLDSMTCRHFDVKRDDR